MDHLIIGVLEGEGLDYVHYDSTAAIKNYSLKSLSYEEYVEDE